MRPFYHILANVLITNTKNSFVWFALTYWVYLETQSVIATGLIGGIFLITNALSGFWLGAVVDHNKKKTAMIGSGIVTLMLFSLGWIIYLVTPESSFTSIDSPILWLLIVTLMMGVMVGAVYNIAVPTLVSILVPVEDHAKANGMYGTVAGISFAITSVGSGLVLGFLGMWWVFLLAVVLSIVSLVHLAYISIPEKEVVHLGGEKPTKKIDVNGTIALIKTIPGLFSLIFYSTFNNFLGGVFMALMDAYGLSLISVQAWGALWGVLSFGFIFGGAYISKKGLGNNPMKTLFRTNIIIWTTCIFFTIQPSIILLAIGMLIWMSFMPFIEATEQTVIQKVVPVERQGRVFGFANSVESAASPLTAFLIGPIAQLVFIPFMTTGAGVELIGSWFGIGPGRGIALVFILAGIIGLMVTLWVMNSQTYKQLAEVFAKNGHE